MSLGRTSLALPSQLREYWPNDWRYVLLITSFQIVWDHLSAGISVLQTLLERFARP